MNQEDDDVSSVRSEDKGDRKFTQPERCSSRSVTPVPGSSTQSDLNEALRQVRLIDLGAFAVSSCERQEKYHIKLRDQLLIIDVR